MKAWTVAELDNVVASLRALLGARLQEVKTLGGDLVLGFYSEGDLLWLWIDLSALRPLLLPWSELPLPLANKKSPLNLFLRAHFFNRVLLDIEREARFGRVVRLGFGTGYELELRLFPHGANVLATAAGKSIAWSKPEPLIEPVGGDAPERVVRDLEQLREQWLAVRSGGGVSKKNAKHDPVMRLRQELERKKKALLKVDQELQRKTEMPWREVGQWLKEKQSLEVPSEWSPFVDKRRKLSWNIEQVFTKARDLEGKIYGTEQRRSLLREEIARLERELTKPVAQISVKPERPAFQPLKDSGVEARTLRINDEMIAVAGKNGADNLKLLRKARAWDFWLHLRDRPGSHVILFRNKSTSVSDAVLRQVIEWFVKLQFGAKLARHSREKMPVIVTECRHVRPIKGDRLGRVNFQNEQILIYQVP